MDGHIGQEAQIGCCILGSSPSYQHKTNEARELLDGGNTFFTFFDFRLRRWTVGNKSGRDSVESKYNTGVYCGYCVLYHCELGLWSYRATGWG